MRSRRAGGAVQEEDHIQGLAAVCKESREASTQRQQGTGAAADSCSQRAGARRAPGPVTIGPAAWQDGPQRREGPRTGGMGETPVPRKGNLNASWRKQEASAPSVRAGGNSSRTERDTAAAKQGDGKWNWSSSKSLENELVCLQVLCAGKCYKASCYKCPELRLTQFEHGHDSTEEITVT